MPLYESVKCRHLVKSVFLCRLCSNVILPSAAIKDCAAVTVLSLFKLRDQSELLSHLKVSSAGTQATDN